jgi:hypothetical protein
MLLLEILIVLQKRLRVEPTARRTTCAARKDPFAQLPRQRVEAEAAARRRRIPGGLEGQLGHQGSDHSYHRAGDTLSSARLRAVGLIRLDEAA